MLRRWQYEWWALGLAIVPLGTGISLDFLREPTTGTNAALEGGDAVLVSEGDFKAIVADIVSPLYEQRFPPPRPSLDDVVATMTAVMWPRVRMVQWWRDNRMDMLGRLDSDPNCEQWSVWIQRWMMDQDFDTVADKKYAPGANTKDGRIHALFQLSSDGSRFCVIPDCYASRSIKESLQRYRPVPYLYDGLPFVTSLDPGSCIATDAADFEIKGFHVLGTALHLGALALRGPHASPTDAQRKNRERRCGIVQWLANVNALPQSTSVPTVIGTGHGVKGDLYPFAPARGQEAFLAEFEKELRLAVPKGAPIFVRCGRRSPCDYIFLYPREAQSHREWVPLLCDAKHTARGEGEGGAVTNDDQLELLNGTLKFIAACAKAHLRLARDAKIYFLTNRKRLTKVQRVPHGQRSVAKCLRKVQETLSVKPEVLNEETFEFWPFTKLLFARRGGK
jgi:hypothetical protein